MVIRCSRTLPRRIARTRCGDSRHDGTNGVVASEGIDGKNIDGYFPLKDGGILQDWALRAPFTWLRLVQNECI
jgi:hypothetical protein